jgi:ABC-type phosphate transport system auxiliary subunit
MAQFFVGVEAALAELLERTDRIETLLEDSVASFEMAVEALIDYTRSLKAENALLKADDEADAAALAAAEAKVAEAEAAFAAVKDELAADTAEEDRLFGLIQEVLPTPPVEEEPSPEPMPEPQDPAAG